MLPNHHHAWDVSPQQAKQIQNDLRANVIDDDQLDEPITRVAGIDVGFEKKGQIARAGIALLGFPKLELLDSAVARRKTEFPYIPGLLSFREIPVILEAFAALTEQPDLLLCDGQGYAHPRRFGLACHLGLLLNVPSIGVAKTRLIGEFDEAPTKRGQWTPLTHRNERIGAVLRTRENIKPLFISIGHRISLETAVKWVMLCTTRFKLPETTRHAHQLASG